MLFANNSLHVTCSIKEKSPIAYDRYDRSHIQMAASAPNSPAHYSGSGLNSPRSIVSGCSGLTAKALYHFPARHPRSILYLHVTTTAGYFIKFIFQSISDST